MTVAIAAILSPALTGRFAHARDCAEASLLLPVAVGTVANAKPDLAWRQLAHAKRYRVQLESRLPEGQVIARMDTIVEGTGMVPPMALATTRAAVKVVVTADCGKDAPPVTARGPTFFIDTASECAAPGEVLVRGGALQWSGSGAADYAVAAFAGDGKVLLRQDVRETRVALPAGAAYASVRARCAGGVSPAVYRVLDAR